MERGEPTPLWIQKGRGFRCREGAVSRAVRSTRQPSASGTDPHTDARGRHKEETRSVCRLVLWTWLARSRHFLFPRGTLNREVRPRTRAPEPLTLPPAEWDPSPVAQSPRSYLRAPSGNQNKHSTDSWLCVCGGDCLAPPCTPERAADLVSWAGEKNHWVAESQAVTTEFR